MENFGWASLLKSFGKFLRKRRHHNFTIIQKMGPLWDSDYASVSGSDVIENIDGEEKVGFLTKVAHESSQPSGKWLLLMICGTILNLFTMAISLATLILNRDPERNAVLKKKPSFFCKSIIFANYQPAINTIITLF
jgi:hypothetical protein